MSIVDQRIGELRKRMEQHQVDAVILPSNDPHQSEYVSDHWKIRAWFSGFTGSAGTLVITKEEAAIWTDSRYFLQAEEECASSEVFLCKQSVPHAPEHVKWLTDKLSENSKIGVDFRLFSISQVEYILGFTHAGNIQLVDIPFDISDVWKDRPSLPSGEIMDYPETISGESRASKLNRVRAELKTKNADFNLITRLDDIAWLFNIRGEDVDFTPLVVSYALVGKEKAYLFVNESRVSESLLSNLVADGVEVLSYANFENELDRISKGKSVLCDRSALNYACFSLLGNRIRYGASYVQEIKSVKNKVEIANAKKVMIRDGVALTRFFMWLEGFLSSGTISEYDLGLRLESYRMREENYKGESFAAIVGYKGNGAIIHYTAPETGSAMVSNEGILLVDSGAQYLEGTTDITRTVWLGGTPPAEIKTAYTAVLRGHIELETMQFPKGTVGMQLDGFSRMHLWRMGLNFPHGTGHGVGSYGMVHEPAQGFASSMTTPRGSTVHLPGQISSIEPGCYKKDAFGIRIENLVVSRTMNETEFGSFIGFETLSRCYIDTRLIDFSQLSMEEVMWLNDYHQRVLNDLGPHLNAQERAWLSDKCKALVVIPEPSTL